MLSKCLDKLLGLYQALLSPMLGNRCRYYPCCSYYARDAIAKHGLIKGSVLAIYRLLRCNPFSDGGIDHVPEHFPTLNKKEVKQ